MSVDPVDVEDLVEIVVTVRVVTGDVTLLKVKRAGHLASLLQRSVVDSAEVVARHRLRDISSVWLITTCSLAGRGKR